MGCSCSCTCSCYYTLLSLALVFAIFGFAGCLTGILGDSWWVKGSIKEGLYRICNETDCYTKDDMFEMDENSSLILILLIISCSFIVLYTIMLLVAACGKRDNIDIWVFAALLSLFASGVSGGSAIAALTYGEIENENKWKEYDHGWSVICTWIGAGFLIFSFLFTIFVVLSGRKTDRIENNDKRQRDGDFQPAGNTFQRDYQQSVDQHCIEMRNQLNRKSLVNQGYVIE